VFQYFIFETRNYSCLHTTNEDQTSPHDFQVLEAILGDQPREVVNQPILELLRPHMAEISHLDGLHTRLHDHHQVGAEEALKRAHLSVSMSLDSLVKPQ
jgi:hypothetical protein